MKTCPTCQSVYSDDTVFCVLDGERLVPQAHRPPQRSSGWPVSAVAAVGVAGGLAVLLGILLAFGGARAEAPDASAPSGAELAEGAFVLAATPVADRPRRVLPQGDGDWLVIFGSFSDYQDADVAARVWTLEQQGLDAEVGRSDSFPNLVSGLRIVYLGPYRQRAAQGLADDLRAVVPDVYIKSGW